MKRYLCSQQQGKQRQMTVIKVMWYERNFRWLNIWKITELKKLWSKINLDNKSKWRRWVVLWNNKFWNCGWQKSWWNNYKITILVGLKRGECYKITSTQCLINIWKRKKIPFVYYILSTQQMILSADISNFLNLSNHLIMTDISDIKFLWNEHRN